MVTAEYHRAWRAKKKQDPQWVEHQRQVYRNYVTRKKIEDPEWWKERKRRKRESYKKHRVLKPKKPKQTLEERKAKLKKDYQKIKRMAIEAYGNECACCSEERIDCLSIHHIGNGRPEGKKKHGINLYSWLRANDFPKGFKVLCLNCNISLGFYGYCPHQGRPEITFTKNTRYYRKLKTTAIQAYGGKCVNCGEKNLEFLQIDHIHGNGNKHRRSIAKSIYVWLKHNNFPNGFQVLCANCNWIKHIKK